jgi:hypothetical protein
VLAVGAESTRLAAQQKRQQVAARLRARQAQQAQWVLAVRQMPLMAQILF